MDKKNSPTASITSDTEEDSVSGRDVPEANSKDEAISDEACLHKFNDALDMLGVRTPPLTDQGGEPNHSKGGQGGKLQHSGRVSGDVDVNGHMLSFIMDGIEPLPTPDLYRASRLSIEGQPGAHAIGGRPPHLCRVQNREPDATAEENESEAQVPIDNACLYTEDQGDTALELADSQNGMALEEVFEGTTICRERIPDQKKFGWLAVFLFTIVVVAISVASLSLVTEGDNYDLGIPSSEELTTGTGAHPPFNSNVSSSTKKNMEDPSHPAFKANVWMWGDPLLETYTWERQKQRFAMVSFFYGLNGQFWFNNQGWLDYHTHECDWFHQEIICDDRGLMVLSNLSHNNLTGAIPDETRHVNTIASMDISYNKVEGSMTVLAATGNVVAFVVSHNKLSGLVRGIAGFKAPNLKVIKLDGNGFEGSLSASFQTFPSVEIYNISGNSFTGTIDQIAESCPNLTHIGLAGNQLSGSLPNNLGLLTLLEELDVSGNLNMRGTIPESLGALNNSLTMLDVSGTAITGSIPHALCQRERGGRLTIKATCSSALKCCD